MIIVRYELWSKTAFLPIIHRFQTEEAANQFQRNNIPYGARNLCKWVEADAEPMQEPTYAGRREPKNRWWDENKRPFSDRLTPEDETSLSVGKLKRKG